MESHNDNNIKIQKNSSLNKLSSIIKEETNIIPEKNYLKKNISEDLLFKTIFNKEKQIGFINIGNTCYINSIIQILIHNKEFTIEFINYVDKIRNNQLSISYKLLNIYEMILKSAESNKKSIDINDFVHHFKLIHSNFSNNEQQDALEFFRVFSEDISNELNNVKKRFMYQKELKYSDDKNKKLMNLEYNNYFNEMENSIISRLFYSQLINTYICECQALTYRFQKIADIPLLIPENVSDINLKELLKIYFSEETVEFKEKCKNCQKVVPQLKYIRFAILPKILIICFQRIDWINNIKNTCEIKFEEKLDINDFIDKDLINSTKCKYQLYGILYHIGDIETGHYISWVYMKSDNCWVEYDDSSISIINNKFYYNNVYSLYYVKL